MNTQPNNIARLNHSNTVYGHIQSWLRKKGNNSESTATEYERDIRLFFQYLRNKNIEDLVEGDVKIMLSDLSDYQTFLVKEYRNEKGNKYKNSTIGRKLESLRSLYNFLKANEYNVNPFIFKELDKLPDDSKRIGFLSPDEAKYLAHLALTTEREKKKEKHAIIWLAASTSIREDALINIKYSDIRKSEHDDDMYIIETTEVFDKGEPIIKEIHPIMYELLIEIKGNKSDDDKIFKFDPTGLNLMIKRLCEKAGIDKKRNISFHSLKKAGVKLAYDELGLHAAQHQAGHSSPITTDKFYLEKPRNIAGRIFFEQIDDSIFDELSRDEMIKLLKSMENGVSSQLRRKAKEIVGGR